MNDAELRKLFTDCVSGDISPEQHALLQEVLKGDSQARAAFREFMDLEAGLRTWATEDAEAELTHVASPHQEGGGTFETPSAGSRHRGCIRRPCCHVLVDVLVSRRPVSSHCPSLR